MEQVKVQKMRAEAILPTRGTKGSAGYDLYACLPETVEIAAGQTMPIPTGIALGIADCQVAGFVYARSGLACKLGMIPANCVGVIDSDYRGEVLVALKNTSTQPFIVHHGDRIAQLVFAPVYLPQLVECDSLDETVRGSGGFGSTGIGGA